MSVNPGFGGQTFIPQTLAKTEKLAALVRKHHCQVIIEIDGGIGLDNYGQLLHAGANALVCGNSIFSSENPALTIAKLKNNLR
jgi:ribulose-phosphate 3-epimerase